MINRKSQKRYIMAACNTLEDARQATSLDECNRLLGMAVDDLASAEERHLAARVQDIKEGRADVFLIQVIIDGLRRSYDLLPAS